METMLDSLAGGVWYGLACWLQLSRAEELTFVLILGLAYLMHAFAGTAENFINERATILGAPLRRYCKMLVLVTYYLAAGVYLAEYVHLAEASNPVCSASEPAPTRSPSAH